MKKFTACLMSVLAGSMIWATDSLAQTTTATVSGQVTDATGSVVPEASITITNVDTGLSRRVGTSGTGFYTIPLLPPGKYKLTVEKQGFQTAEYPGIVLQVGQALTIDSALIVGAITQSVTIEAQAPQLQSTSSELGSVITTKAVEELPLNGRNFSQLLLLTPGVSPVSTGQYASVGFGFGSNPGIPGSTFSNPSVGGQWPRGNLYLLDGLNFTSWFTGAFTVLPVVDSIREFKVQSHNDSGEYGGAPGGFINVATKSGTNSLHGSVWEFVRNDVFDARNPFSDANRDSPAAFRQNEFGAAVGGPVYIPGVYDGRDRTHFFFTYEGWRYRRPAQSFARVPTAAELNGDFSANYTTQRLFDPETTRPDPNNPGGFIRDPFVCDTGGTPVAQGTAGAVPCNKIPTSRIDPMSLGWMQAFYDAPNLSGNAAFNYINNLGSSNNNDTWMLKIDQRFTDRDTAWFRILKMDNPRATPINSRITNLASDPPWNIGGGETHLFGPNLIFDARFGYNTYPEVLEAGPNSRDHSATEALGFGGQDRYGYVSLLLGPPYSSLGLNGPLKEYYQDWHFNGSLTWVKGNHTLKGGFQLFWLRYQCCALEPGMGQRNEYTFTNPQSGDPNDPGNTGDALASALLGFPSQTFFAAQKFDFNFKNLAPYIEDRWQVTPKLTLTVGLRYDYTTAPRVNESTLNVLDPATGFWHLGGGVLPPACNVAMAAPCIPGDGLVDVANSDKIVVSPNPGVGPLPVNTNFGPRLGLAYRASDKTVFRAGYGLNYGTMMGVIQTVQGLLGTWPQASAAQNTRNNDLAQTYLNLQDLQSVSVSALPGPDPWNISTWMFDRNQKNSRSHQWNAGIQRQMTQTLMLSAAYVGSHSDRLPVTGVFNLAPTPGPGTPAEVNARRPYPWAAPTWMQMSVGKANYHSLQLTAEKRYSQGLQFLVSYTWSKSTDLGGSGFFAVENGPGGGGASSIQNFHDISRDWGVSAYDIPHYISVALQYAFPAGKGKPYLNSGPGAWILGNWQLNTITTARSGQPFNLRVLGDVANVGNTISSNVRPNLVGDPKLSNPTAERWFNLDAFEIPSLSFGTAGRNILRSAAVYNVDLSLFKKFPIKETVDLEFRAEAFNAFNIQNLGVPGGQLGTTSAGVINGVVIAPRQFQLGMKLNF